MSARNPKKVLTRRQRALLVALSRGQVLHPRMLKTAPGPKGWRRPNRDRSLVEYTYQCWDTRRPTVHHGEGEVFFERIVSRFVIAELRRKGWLTWDPAPEVTVDGRWMAEHTDRWGYGLCEGCKERADVFRNDHQPIFFCGACCPAPQEDWRPIEWLHEAEGGVR
jgi:hypothetical protein